MDQTVIGYISWNDPPRNNLRAVRLVDIDLPEAAAMGVAVEGANSASTNGEASLPSFDAFNQQRHYLDVFNRGKATFNFTATSSEPWISVSETGGTIEKEKRIWVSIDWDKAPKDTASGTIKISGANGEVAVKVSTLNPAGITRQTLHGFVEGEGVVSIEPEHYSKRTGAGQNHWIRIEDYGRTLSGMRASSPVDAPSATPQKDSPTLEYRMYLFSTGQVDVVSITSPVLNFAPDRGVRFAVSFDDEAPQIVTLVPKGYSAMNGNRDWEESVKDNARYAHAKLTIDKPGYHTLKYWMVDPGVVLQKIVVNTGGLKPSYLGPPESYHNDISAAAN
jgi:hypothetical protein